MLRGSRHASIQPSLKEKQLVLVEEVGLYGAREEQERKTDLWGKKVLTACQTLVSLREKEGRLKCATKPLSSIHVIWHPVDLQILRTRI